jgi:hypothetical protein
METVAVIVVLVLAVLLALGVYGTVKVVGAAKRGVDRRVEQTRRAVEDTTLRARTYVRPGAVGELAQLRLGLRGSMRATQEALRAGVGDDPSLKEALGLFERLSAHGHELDAHLKRLESEPDTGHVARLLPELRTRTGQIRASADALRHAARDRASHFASDDLDALQSQIDVEAGALRHWDTVADTNTNRDRGTVQGAAQDPGPSRGRIEPPRARPVYPWEKKAPRPESTT